MLDLTGAPFDAGVVRFAATLPILLYLQAGAVVDRYDRRRVMLATEAVRFAAIASVVVALWAGVLTLAHIVVAALVLGIGLTVFQVAERSSIPRLVPPDDVAAALVRNAARMNAGLVIGQTTGGVLYGLGRVLPFAVDALTYLVSLASIGLIRTPLQERTPAERRDSRIREGIGWLVHDPLLRTTTLLVAGNNMVVNALYLALIVIAEERGAAPGEIGAMLAFIGIGGFAGSLVAGRLARALSLRAVVVLALGLKAVLTPLLLLMPNAYALGVVYGAMFFVDATWGAVVGARQLAAIPDALQGRVNGAILLVALGSVPLASLAVGALLQWAGGTATIVALAAAMIATTLAGLLSRTIKSPPSPAVVPAS